MKIALCAGLLLLLPACTSATRTFLTRPTAIYENAKPNLIQVFVGEPPRKARPIALVAVARDGENATWAVEVLKMEAAEIGADAISNLEMNYTTGIFPTLRVQGLAVKYE